MKQQSWGDIFFSILKKVGSSVFKLLIFFLWVIASAVETLLHELNTTMKSYLFPNKN
jgi:hypothetical protein